MEKLGTTADDVRPKQKAEKVPPRARVSWLVDHRIVPRPFGRKDPGIRSILWKGGARTLANRFEDRVFAFFHANRRRLGIVEVQRFANRLVDGGIRLSDGRWIAVEIKYRMNWLKACQTGWQFENFLTSHAGRTKWRGGIVVFDRFSGDWARKRGITERGWDRWYHGHARLRACHFKITLLRLSRAGLTPYPKH